MGKKSNLLTPEDEIIKERIAKKFRSVLSKKQHLLRLKRLFSVECEHPNVLFFEEDCTFRCIVCSEKLVKLQNKNEFRIFCELTGKDPKNLCS